MNYPSRIICLTEETTELLYLLGEESRIAGITVYTVRPERAKKEKPTVSSFISGNIKKIKGLNPDLILGFSDIQADLAKDLIREGFNVFISNQRSIEEIFQTMIWIGSIVGKQRETIHLVDSWKYKVESIRRDSATRIQSEWNGNRPKVFFQEWNEPIITGIRWVTEILEIAGAEDAFGDLKDKSLAKDRIISSENVQERNPDLIIGSWCGKPVDFAWIRDQEKWKECPAIRNNDLYEIDSSIILQPGPALFLDGLEKIAQILKNSNWAKIQTEKK
jgi:iron complex transport system substrate-binding protein